MSVANITGNGKPNIQNTDKAVDINSVSVYNFMDNAYSGKHGFRDGRYLVPHDREMWYDSRRQLAFYKNFVKPIIQAMIRPVFADRVARTGFDRNGKFQLFIWNCDNAGTYLQNFTETVIRKSRLHSIVFTVVENFPEDKQPATDAEAKEQRIFPYVYMKKANEVQAYTLDSFGNIETITFTDKDIVSIDPITKKAKVEKRWRKWTDKESISLKMVNDKMKEIETIEHNLGFVPVITIYDTEREDLNDLYVDPSLYDMAKLNHTLFNKDSEMRELERSQGFSMFYVPGDSNKNLTIGDKNVLFVPVEASFPPGFASPDPNISKQLLENAEKTREDLFRIAEQSGVVGVKSSSSGIAMQWDFFAHNSVLKKSSSLATELEEKISEIFEAYTKEDLSKYYVDYPKTFQPNDADAELNKTDRFLLLGMPPKATALAKTKVARMMFADEDEDTVEEVIKEIEEEITDETQSKFDEMAAQIEALQDKLKEAETKVPVIE